MKTLINQLEDIIKLEIPTAEAYLYTEYDQSIMGVIVNGNYKVGFEIEPEMLLQEALDKVIAPAISNLKQHCKNN
jgi:hypothetical protein